MKNFIEDSGINETAEVGLLAPDFALINERGEQWRLSDQRGKVTALLFYPKSETLVSTKQMCSVRDHWTDYLETKAVVVGISPGTTEELQKFSAHHRLPIRLLADPKRRVTKNFCSHWWMPTALTRSIVIVDANGYVRFRRVMLRALRPTDFQVLSEIYAAKTRAVLEKHAALSKSSWGKT